MSEDVRTLLCTEQAYEKAEHDIFALKNNSTNPNDRKTLDEALKLLEESKKAADQHIVDVAQRKLDDVKRHLESLPGASTNPDIKKAIDSLRGVTINDVASASQVDSLVSAAQQVEQAEAGAVIQQTMMAGVSGLAGIGAMLGIRGGDHVCPSSLCTPEASHGGVRNALSQLKNKDFTLSA